MNFSPPAKEGRERSGRGGVFEFVLLNLTTLPDWLNYLERLHPKSIDMGLARVAQVKSALALTPAFPIITVGGTNGKGSTCALLEEILCRAGYRVGCYTSPHLLRYNERVKINRQEAGDAALCAAFAEIETARGDISLTYFEFGTLAAMRLFIDAKVDVAILEVGLGGRLDAVNVFDADCAVVTGIALDHVEYLGDTRDKIGAEKAGIYRGGIAAICADPQPPASVRQHADNIGAHFFQLGKDFGYTTDAAQWHYWGAHSKHHSLPYPALRGVYQLQNAAAALAALGAVKDKLPVSMNDIRQGLLEVQLAGRFQVLPGRPAVVLDVAHNPQAAAALAENLGKMPFAQNTYAVFGMLQDKDIAGVIAAIRHRVDVWLIAGLGGFSPRGAAPGKVRAALLAAGIDADDNNIAQDFTDPASAYKFACERVTENDRICVFGSFYTVAAVLQQMPR